MPFWLPDFITELKNREGHHPVHTTKPRASLKLTKPIIYECPDRRVQDIRQGKGAVNSVGVEVQLVLIYAHIELKNYTNTLSSNINLSIKEVWSLYSWLHDIFYDAQQSIWFPVYYSAIRVLPRHNYNPHEGRRYPSRDLKGQCHAARFRVAGVIDIIAKSQCPPIAEIFCEKVTAHMNHLLREFLSRRIVESHLRPVISIWKVVPAVHWGQFFSHRVGDGNLWNWFRYVSPCCPEKQYKST